MASNNTYCLPVELPETVVCAMEVLCNCYGIGDERKKLLKEAGYDADKVQKCVNELVNLFEKYR